MSLQVLGMQLQNSSSSSHPYLAERTNVERSLEQPQEMSASSTLELLQDRNQEPTVLQPFSS